MCDLVQDKCQEIKATFLEPACGTGNFLAEILSRKLLTVKKNFAHDYKAYALNSIHALTSLYGIDILEDNVKECRDRLLWQWVGDFSETLGFMPNQKLLKFARRILNTNIICGDTLNNGEPIIFTEWIFDGFTISCKDDSLAAMKTRAERTDDTTFPLFDTTEEKKEEKNYKPINFQELL